MSRLFLPAATNYHANPSLEGTYVGGLAPGLSVISSALAGSIVKEPVAGRTGGQAQRIAYTGLAGDAGDWILMDSAVTAVGSFAAGEVVTASFYYRGTLGAGIYNAGGLIAALDAAGASVGNSGAAPMVTSADWTRCSVTYTLPANTSKIYLRMQWNGHAEGTVIDLAFDDFQIEKSPFPTPYFDGYTVDGNNSCAWTGAANASTSTRAVSDLQFAPGGLSVCQSFGTIAMRYSPLIAADASPAFQTYAQFDKSGTARTYLDSGGALANSYRMGAGGQSASAASQTFGAGSTQCVVGRWSRTGPTIDLNVNGVDASQVTTAWSADPGAIDILRVGYGNGRASNAYEGPLLLSPTRKPDAWVTAIQANSGAAYSDINRLKREFMAPGDALWVGNEGDINLWVKGS